MTRGRAPEVWLDEDGPGPIDVELIELQARQQLQIRQPGRRCVKWIQETKSVRAVLELAEPGQLILRPWEPLGEKIAERQRELAADLEDEEHQIAYLALAERFLGITVEKGGRFPIHARTARHLGIGAPIAGVIHLYQACFPDKVEIWSEEFRQNIRPRLAQYLDWLP